MKTFVVDERTMQRFTATIFDEARQPIPAKALDSLTLTLYDRASNSVINNRNAQNVLNANGVTVDPSGNLAWLMSPADNTIFRSVASETHIALFEWTYGPRGAKRGNSQVGFSIRNVQPAA